MYPRHIVVPGATIALTRRTAFRKAFLAPWDPLVAQAWLYCLAEAQAACEVAVHLSNLVVTHHHTDITLTKPNLGRFLKRLHREFSCFLNTLLAEHRYDAPREVFDDRSCHAMRLMDDAAQVTQLVYGRCNPVAAGLVQRPEHMPGNVIDFDLWKRAPLVIRKPPLYFGKDRPAEVELVVTPPPLLMRAFDGDLDRAVYHLNKLTTDVCQHLRETRKRPAMGAQKVTRIHPWNEPRTLRERGGERAPSFRIGSRGIIAREHDQAARLETRMFRHEHEAVRVARRDGDLTATFPFATYGARVHLNAPCETEPKDTAFVTKPGPLLQDVMSELVRERRTRSSEQREQRHTEGVALLTEARAAFMDEADEVIAHAAVNFDEQSHRGGNSHDNTTRTAAAHDNATHSPERTEPRQKSLVVHRFSRRDNDPATAPGRLVTLRDARRGRPRSTSKHGADPPA